MTRIFPHCGVGSSFPAVAHQFTISGETGARSPCRNPALRCGAWRIDHRRHPVRRRTIRAAVQSGCSRPDDLQPQPLLHKGRHRPHDRGRGVDVLGAASKLNRLLAQDPASDLQRPADPGTRTCGAFCRNVRQGLRHRLRHHGLHIPTATRHPRSPRRAGCSFRRGSTPHEAASPEPPATPP